MCYDVCMNGQPKRYTPQEFAQLAHVSVKTLQRWDRSGVLVAGRTVTGRRVYTDLHLQKVREKEEGTT